jgi:hypothetical protein
MCAMRRDDDDAYLNNVVVIDWFGQKLLLKLELSSQSFAISVTRKKDVLIPGLHSFISDMHSQFTFLFFLMIEIAAAFAPFSVHYPRTLLIRKLSDDGNGEQRRLLLSQEEIAQKMNQLRSKYPTSEADYLAAARARNEAKLASAERQATEDDWMRVAREKKEMYGDQDDWEASAKEAGNIDSQILLPMLDEEGEGGEPTLLL